jgi:hypothetical protein
MYWDFIDDDGFPRIRESGDFYSIVILKDKFLTTELSLYKYNINNDTTEQNLFEMAKWCEGNLEQDWMVGCNISGFMNKQDAFKFKLRWGGG